MKYYRISGKSPNGKFIGVSSVTNSDISNMETDCNGFKKLPERVDGAVVIEIGAGCFAGTEIIAVDIPDTVESIGDNAFSGCKGLVAVSLPETLKLLGDEVFSDCKILSDINFPTSLESARNLKEVGDNVFKGCKTLEQEPCHRQRLGVSNALRSYDPNVGFEPRE